MSDMHCSSCGEPIKPTWRICPVCETQLKESKCPSCGQAVKPNWKRCPECEAALVCPQCQTRLAGDNHCPKCREAEPVSVEKEKDTPMQTVCDIEMVWVPGGTFDMGDISGDGADNETPVHAVTLTGFYMARFAVTQAQWQRMMKDNPAKSVHPDRPVEQITWDEAIAFIDRLNDACRGTCRVDLPTEAQWEYAARSGGRKELYAGGDDVNAVAWYDANSQGRTHRVGQKVANGLGLYDMSGNVWEWCRDVYSPDAYSNHPARNPFVDLPLTDRIIRGGSWHLDAWSARCTRRFSCDRDFMGPALGFRIVMQNLSINK